MCSLVPSVQTDGASCLLVPNPRRAGLQCACMYGCRRATTGIPVACQTHPGLLRRYRGSLSHEEPKGPISGTYLDLGCPLCTCTGPLLKVGLFTSLHLPFSVRAPELSRTFSPLTRLVGDTLDTYCCPTAPLSISISMVGPVLPHRTDRLTTSPYLDRTTALPLARTKLD